jgi:hypothetical protein
MPEPVVESTPLVAPAGARAPQGLFSWLWVTYGSRETGLAVTLTLVGFTSMLRCGIMNALMSAQQPELVARGFNEAVTLYPGLSAIFSTIGKLSQIFVITRFGVYWTMTVALTGIAAGLSMMATAESDMMSAGLSLTAFSNAHLWGCGVRVLANWVDGKNRGTAVGLSMGATSDGATMLFSILIAYMQAAFRPTGSWRATFIPFMVFAGATAVHVLLNIIFLRGSAEDAGFEPPSAPPGIEEEEEEELADGDQGEAGGAKKEVAPAGHPLDGMSSGAALLVLLGHARTYLGIGMGCSFAMVCAFPNFVGTFGVVIGFDDSSASLLLVAAGLGSLIADIGAGFAQDRLSPKMFNRMGLVLQIIGFASLCLVLRLWMLRRFEQLRAVMPIALALINVPIGLYWNVVLSCFAVRFGGPTHSATLSGMMDFVSFICVIPVQFVFGSLVTQMMWTTVLTLTTCFFFSAIVCINLHYHLESTLSPLPTVPKR